MILDASAALAVLVGEAGEEKVRAAFGEACIGAVNASEVVARLIEWGATDEEALRDFGDLPLEIIPFDRGQALMAGLLRRQTRGLGLSLGDRACLALAKARGLPVLTADRAWEKLDLDIDIRLVR